MGERAACLSCRIGIEGQEPRFRATLCRCGASKSKPFCDSTHKRIGFTAEGGGR
ncbi:MAG: hypothetical protein GEU91_03005 [Rhizobiales bacterium]|nr:hypothetical protein [Hyphomicrobiales bacterium]